MSNTRSRRNNFLKKYQPISKESRARLTYQSVKSLDIEAKKTKTSFKKLFEKQLSEKRKAKVRYIAKKYDLPKADASEILNIALTNNFSYDKAKEFFDEKNKLVLTTNIIDCVNQLRNNHNEKDNFFISISLPFFSFDGVPDQFILVSTELRNAFDEYAEENFSEYMLDENAYLNFSPLILMEFNDIPENARTVIVTCVDDFMSGGNLKPDEYL